MSKSVGLVVSFLALPVMIVTAADVAPATAAPAAAPVVAAPAVAAPAPAAAPAVAAPAIAAPAAAPAPAVAVEKKDVSPFRLGFDERLRWEETDKIPVVTSASAGTKSSYYRFRTRLWAELDIVPNVTFGGRLANEFRRWSEPNKRGAADASTYVFPDELLVDSLYLQAKNLAGFDFKVGRQDITDLSSRIIYDGTAEDGSRSIYFNAVRVTYKGIEKTTIDALGMYVRPQDAYAMDSVDRDLTGFTSSYDNMSESGAGLYVKNSSVKELPVEIYGFYKRESAWNSSTNGVSSLKAWQTRSTVIANAKSDIGLGGFKVKPDFGGGVKGRLEAAYEFGKRGDADISAYMGDAGLSYDLPVAQTLKPTIEGSWYYLSGDDSSSSKDEGWDPLWARYPQDSEALVLTYSRGKWSNLSMPTAKASMDVVKDVRASLAASIISAPEKSATGSEMGNLYVAKLEFANLASGMLSKTPGKTDKLTGHLWFEMLDPGNYFKSGSEMAYFARAQLTYTY